MMFLGILGLLGFLVFILAAIVYAIKKNPRWKKCLGIAGICVIMFLVGALNDTTETDPEQVEAAETQAEEQAPEEPTPEEIAAAEELAKEQEEALAQKIDELIEVSEGVVVSITPKNDDWSIMYVTVSDAWYQSEEYEQERFAGIVVDTLQKITRGYGKEDGATVVSFYDTYDKEVATTKIMGGIKLK